MVQEQCCHNQLQELHCATGINLANEQDSCTTPPGDNTSLEATFVKVRPHPPPSSAAAVHQWEAWGTFRPAPPAPGHLSFRAASGAQPGRQEGPLTSAYLLQFGELTLDHTEEIGMK